MHSELRTDDLVELVVRVPRRELVLSMYPAEQRSLDVGDARLRLAKSIIGARRYRSAIAELIGLDDAKWDLCLEIYILASEGRAVQISKIIGYGKRSQTTSLRHLHDLLQMGLLTRTPHPTDRRSSLITMTQRLKAGLEQWLDYRASSAACC